MGSGAAAVTENCPAEPSAMSPPAIPVELRRAFWDIARDGMAADEPD